MRFGSVCSGIEAASVAWEPLGWQAAWFSEIEPFPCALLKHKYPAVPNYGNMTTLPARIRGGEVEAPDLFCGGTPCQAFSVAGLRQSLADDRGNLSLVFCEVANAIDAVRSARGDKPCIVFWENVPGVLSIDDNAFGCFLAGLAGETVPLEPAGRRWTDAGVVLGPTRAVAWRVLDAQYFGVAQRRKRVFVVASARDDFDCAAVLFEREGVRRDTAPSREAGQIASTIPSRSTAGGGLGTDFDCDGGLIPHTIATLDTQCGATKLTHQTVKNHLIASRMIGFGDYVDDETASTVKARDWKDATDLISTYDSRQHHNPQPSNTAQLTTKNCAFVRGDTPLVAHAFHARATSVDLQNASLSSEIVGTIDAEGQKRFNRGQGVLAHAFHARATDVDQYGNVSGTLDTDGQTIGVHTSNAVRRLTPRECERLQGFPDDYTAIPYKGKPAADCPDGPRYKALGNSWAVPVVRWIGNRIQQSTR